MSDRQVAVPYIATMTELDVRCAGCGSSPRPEVEFGGHSVVRCPDCGLYVLLVNPTRRDVSLLDRTQYAGALREIRLANYARILAQLQQLGPLAGRTVLDVGCSTGWFLEAAGRAGCVGYGIEPDAFFYERARQALSGARLAHGYFPDDLPTDWAAFDLITFHDVFEHLPDPASILRACRDRLTPGGCVVLSLPDADGFVFHLARVLSRLGLTGPLARLFQAHYPFPHLFYFTRQSLVRLAQNSGFDAVSIQPLQSFSARGALSRARMDRANGWLGELRAYASAAALLVFAALDRLLPADNMLAILRPRST